MIVSVFVIHRTPDAVTPVPYFPTCTTSGVPEEYMHGGRRTLELGIERIRRYGIPVTLLYEISLQPDRERVSSADAGKYSEKLA